MLRRPFRGVFGLVSGLVFCLGLAGSDDFRVLDFAEHVDDAIEAATYAPIIAVALGVYAADRIMGGFQRDAKKERERAYRERVAPSLQIGDSFDRLIDLMGSYEHRDRVGIAEAYTYSDPSYTYGFVNDKLVWKESPSMLGNTLYPALSCPDKTLWSPPE